MRSIVRIVLPLLAALVLGAASAQPGLFVAGSAGWPGVELYVGVHDIGLEGLDARVGVGGYFIGVLTAGVDVLYGFDLDLPDTPVEVYLGAGVGASVSVAYTAQLRAFVGGAYRLDAVGAENMRVFLEVGPRYDLTFGVDPDARLGVSYAF